MDTSALRLMATLIRGQRAASLGTLREGAPLVTLVVYAYHSDFSAFYLHLSRLAQHTQALLVDRRAGLMIAEAEVADKDPQLLMRLSIQAEAVPMERTSSDYAAARSLYLVRFPAAEPMFSLGDFDVYRLAPRAARFVAGFGQAYNLAPGHFAEAAGLA